MNHNTHGKPNGYTYTQPPGWRATRQRIFNRDRYRCYMCSDPRPADEIDHVLPVSQGGTHDDSNLAACHASPCHAAKTENERRFGIARKQRKRPTRRNPNIIDA